ncbi:hypothetical protein PPUN110474_27540 [Pseudomonas putida]|nr:hypothetical protein PPUN110474_27540 [Pseudomonas putida]
MPIRLEAAALQIAAGILPLAKDVNAIADCTVAGKAQRYKKPMYRSLPTKGIRIGFMARPSRGKSTNVQRNTRK